MAKMAWQARMAQRQREAMVRAQVILSAGSTAQDGDVVSRCMQLADYVLKTATGDDGPYMVSELEELFMSYRLSLPEGVSQAVADHLAAVAR